MENQTVRALARALFYTACLAPAVTGIVHAAL